jgi:hypothetical protein
MENERMWGALYHGWVELLTLFAMLLVALVIMGWSYNRGLRPAERGAVVGWFPLIVCFGLVILLRQIHASILPAIIISLGVLIAGFMSRVVHPGGLWIPIVILACFLGLGLNLTALVFTLATALVLLLSARPAR